MSTGSPLPDANPSSLSGPASRDTPRLDLHTADPCSCGTIFFRLAIQSNQEDLPSRTEFCKELASSSFPASESTFCHFVAWLASKGITHGTVRVYISSVCQLQISKGLHEPKVDGMARLSQESARYQQAHRNFLNSQ